MRAIWKGYIRFSLVTIPIRIYSALNPEQSISFNQLHKEDMGRVRYEKRCKKCDKPLTPQEIIKGYEYEPDKYVIMEDQDFAKIKLKSTKMIEIAGFVDSAEIHPSLYDAPYFAGPDGEIATKAYALFCKTLKDSGKMGIGKVILRDREDMVLLTPFDNAIMLYKLRYPNEVRNIDEIPLLNKTEVEKDQLKLAHTLIDSMTTNLSEIALVDQYKESVKELIHSKIEGKEFVAPEEETQPVTDLMSALKQSLEKAKIQRMPMEKAKGKKKKAAAPETEGKTKSRKRKQA